MALRSITGPARSTMKRQFPLPFLMAFLLALASAAMAQTNAPGADRTADSGDSCQIEWQPPGTRTNNRNECERQIGCRYIPAGECYCPPLVNCVCGGGEPPQCVWDPSVLPEEVASRTAGNVTAHFLGEDTPQSTPTRFGVRGIVFSLEDDDRIYPFRPQGTVSFSDWRLDIFSPDGTKALLVQDRHGPYHIVNLSNLKAYLERQAPPDYVVKWTAGEDAVVHENPQWTGPSEGTFAIGCCESRRQIAFSLDGDSVHLSPISPREDAHPKEGADKHSAPALTGNYEVTDVRMSQQTPHTLSIRQDMQRWLGERGEIGDVLSWRGGIVCDDWRASVVDKPAPSDPAISDFVAADGDQGDEGEDGEENDGPRGWFALDCGPSATVRLYAADRTTLLEPTANGTAWLIWRRR